MASNRAALAEEPPQAGPAIAVWPFWAAPNTYQQMSSLGGGERWLAHVPAWLVDVDGDPPAWLDHLDAGMRPEIVELDNGDQVIICGR